jgi:hypothetical protein
MTVIDWNKVRVRELNPLRRRRKRSLCCPLTWAAKAAIATNTPKALVWVWLVQQARRTRSNTVTMSNEVLAKHGISRKVKALALRQLGRAGLITIERRHGKAPFKAPVLPNSYAKTQ